MMGVSILSFTVLGATLFGGAPASSDGYVVPPGNSSNLLSCNVVKKKKTWTCVINASIVSKTDLTLHFDGNVIFRGHINVTTSRSIRLFVSGFVHLQGQASLSAHRNITVVGKDFTSSSGSSVFAMSGAVLFNLSKSAVIQGNETQVGGKIIQIIAAGVSLLDGCTICAVDVFEILSVPDAGVPSCSGGVDVKGRISLRARKISIQCPDGDVHFSDRSLAQDSSGNGTLDVKARSLFGGSDVSISFANVDVSAARDVELHFSSINSAFLARECRAHSVIVNTTNTETITWTSLNISSQSDIVISPPADSRWHVSFLALAANAISLENTYIITDMSKTTACHNNQSSHSDACRHILKQWDDGVGDILDATNSSALNVSFDGAIVARTEIKVTDTKLLAASMLVCSGGRSLYTGSTFDVTGRGCRPGVGVGAGSTRESSVECGGSGASHLGSGGWGVGVQGTHVIASASPARPYDFLGEMLPTAAASGGGCGVPTAVCSKISSAGRVMLQSAGGGLLWVSANPLVVVGSVSLKADAADGDLVSPVTSGVSGGGSGGQIIIFVSSLQVHNRSDTTADGQLKLSARGGHGACTNTRASGGGGGGFIGLKTGGDASDNINTGSISIDVSGGTLPETCDALGPAAAQRAAAEPGFQDSLEPCKPGYAGFFCSACTISQYSEDGKHCYQCDNKPRNAIYAASAWPNKTCMYKCPSGTQDVAYNPRCLTGIAYALSVFGGKIGLGVAFSCFILLSLCVLCRRKWPTQTQSRMSLLPSSFAHNGGLCRRIASRINRACCPRPHVDRDIRANSRNDNHLRVNFHAEHLPYHVCRAYLSGQNREGHSWALDPLPPPQFEHLVVHKAWSDFASEVNLLARMPNRSTRVQRLFWCIHPLVAIVWERHCRRKRAKSLRACTERFSQGSDGRQSLWALPPEHATDNTNTAPRLTVIFGSDEGATLGYLDVLDFSRSQLDFAPVDLRFEVRLFVAHGHGSYEEPYAINIRDPLVHHLSQTDLGNHAVCSVISTFNRIARRVRASTSGDMMRCPLVHLLQSKVKKVASHCGLEDFVQVILMELPASGVSEESVSDSTFMSSYSVQRESEVKDRFHADQPSFSDLVRSEAAAGGNRIRERFRAQSSKSNDVESEYKLCLVFTDRTSLPRLNEPQDCQLRSPRRRWAGFSSPMAQRTLVKYLIRRNTQFGPPWTEGTNVNDDDSEGGASSADDVAMDAHGRLVGSGTLSAPICLRCRYFPLGVHCRDSRSAVIFLALLLLFIVNILLNILACFSLFVLRWYSFVVWNTWPPFTPVVDVGVGIYFLLTDSPWVGRIYTLLVLLGIPGLVATTLFVVYSQADALVFQLVVLAAAATVRAALSFVANLRVGDLEAGLDLAFAEASQADFLVRVLSTNGQLRGEGRRMRSRFTNGSSCRHDDTPVSVLQEHESRVTRGSSAQAPF
eukprot:TRINITY_DN40063_c0_g1_i1.p1 TRINITY_DN40063_c0_g1~~TRINITY_DN40063_c0_g1_i1.p1  ORF type:complete len:1442 (-),score=122.28 TRINITY_DN40063_c0_g1_i1:119-4444(-)